MKALVVLTYTMSTYINISILRMTIRIEASSTSLYMLGVGGLNKNNLESRIE